MRFGVLGPLQVVDGAGTPVVVSAAKQRIVLAALMLANGGTVSPARLAEALWDERPPPNAAAVMRTYVMRLRRVLGPAGARVVVRPAGWALELRDAGELDVAEVDLRRRAVRTAATAGEWSLVSDELSAALGLWRGEPLADVPSAALARREVGRLEELRCQLTESRIDADLRLGRHGEVVAELRGLTAEHPLREHFRVLLMLACYRCGHQAAALEVFRDARRTLADELGVEPGRELREVHQRILTGDPELAAVPQAVATVNAPPVDDHRNSPAMPVPRQLPVSVPVFTGRAAELTRLTELARQATAGGSAAIPVISGMAGVGKTALAVHWAHQVAGLFPDGQLYANLRGYGPTGEPADPTHVVRGFLNALGVMKEWIPDSLDAQAGLYRSLLAGKQILVVLDNARDEAQVRSLLPGGPGCLAIVTSRNQLAGLVAVDGARPFMLHALAEDEAASLLSARLGTRRVKAEPTAVSEIIRLCARLPLALAIAAGRAAARPAHPLAELATELRDADARLDTLDGGEPAASTRAVFSWSHQHLSAAGARMFQLLGIHPGPDISIAAAASLAGLSPPAARRALRELTAASLLSECSAGRYTLHDLLRCYATDLASSPNLGNDRWEATRRILDHYSQAASSAARLLAPMQALASGHLARGVTPETIHSSRQALSWFDAEHHVLLAIMAQAARTGACDQAQQIAAMLEPFFTRRGNWPDLAVAQQTALHCSGLLADPAGQARAHLHLGRALGRLGQTDPARTHLAQAVDLSSALGDRSTEARAHLALSDTWSAGEFNLAQALASCLRALELAEAETDMALMAHACNNLGYDYALHGDAARALTYCRRALDLRSQAETDPALEAQIHDSLGYTYHCLGDQRRAIASYWRAVRTSQAIGAPHLGAESLSNLGDCHAAADDYEAAVKAWQQALVILDQLGHPDSSQLRRKLSQSLRPAGREFA